MQRPKYQIFLLICLLLFEISVFAKNDIPAQAQVDSLLKKVWYLRDNNTHKALVFAIEAIKLADSINDFYRLAKAYSYIGVLYRNLGLYSAAINYYNKALHLSRENGFVDDIGYNLNNIADIYIHLNLPEKALEYLAQADTIASLTDNKDLKSYVLQNFGRAYLKMNQPKKALSYLREALIFRKKYKLYNKLAVSYKDLGDVYKELGELKKAKQMYVKCMQKANFKKDIDLFISLNYSLADLYFIQNKIDSAFNRATIALQLANAHNFKYRMFLATELLSKIYLIQKQYSLAYFYERKALNLEKEIHKAELLATLQALELNEELLNKELALRSMRNKWRYEQELSHKKSTIILISVSLLAVVTLLFIVLIFYNRKIKRLNQTIKYSNALISQAYNELKQQSSELEKAYTELKERDQIIHESVNYAKSILLALMGEPDILLSFDFVKAYFLIFKPMEIISGDFYYFRKERNFKAIIVGDSTGHSIPGAFISILSISMFNDLFHIYTSKHHTAAFILEKFRKRIFKILNLYDPKYKYVKVGVDLGLCLIYEEDKIMHFAGAYHSLYVFNNLELTVYKGTRSSAGISIIKQAFVNYIIPLDEIERFYLFTDGITDQFGGNKNSKLTRKRWLDFLKLIQNVDMQEQKIKIEGFLSSWQGNQEQTDDILILGVEIDKDKLQ